MVLLGGIQTLTGPIVGAAAFTLLQDTIMRQTEYWRALLGGIILLLVLVFPGGLVGRLRGWRRDGKAQMTVLSVVRCQIVRRRACRRRRELRVGPASSSP